MKTAAYYSAEANESVYPYREDRNGCTTSSLTALTAGLGFAALTLLALLSLII